MLLKPIPYALVSASIAASHTAGNNHGATSDLNTDSHTLASLSAAPSHPRHITHHDTTPSPLHDPFTFSTCLPLIAHSQHLPPTSHHTIRVPSSLAPDTLAAHARWLRTGALPPSLLAALAAAWPALGRALDGGGGEGPRMHVVLTPWNARMDPGREFRVFVPPVGAMGRRGRGRGRGGLRVAAVSQYRWHEPLGLAGVGFAETVVEGAERVVGEVVEFAREKGGTLLGELEGMGFVVDVALMGEEGAWEVQMVELNPFGALTGCGSCLFHWIRDARVLYRLDGEVEMRVAVDGDADD